MFFNFGNMGNVDPQVLQVLPNELYKKCIECYACEGCPGSVTIQDLGTITCDEFVRRNGGQEV